MLFFDIGANVGNWSLKNIEKCEKIIAIEPSKSTYEKLIVNCENKNITCLNYAVCNNDNQEIDFYEAGNQNVLSTINLKWLTNPKSRFYKYHKDNYVKTKCNTITIDKLIDSFGIPDLIKIDAEGSEHKCLLSLTKKTNTTICFEWAQEFPKITNKCINHLLKLGFNKFHVQFEGDPAYRPPSEGSYTTKLDAIYSQLKENRTVIKSGRIKPSWGMIWCIN